MAVWWRQWADKNREHLAAYDRTYKAANRQRYRDYQNARRARRLKQFVEDVESAVLFERDQGICGICGEAVDPLDFQMDHRVPLCQGGEHSYANTQVSHPRCNLRKARGPRLAPSTPATTLAPLGTTNQGAEPWSN
jgi:5-methylcytosine-specific restriction endonuclease McrA